MKVERQKPSGLLQPLPIPERKWKRITMDFVFKLPPKIQRHDDIWVVVDRLTKFTHFIPIREKFSPFHLKCFLYYFSVIFLIINLFFIIFYAKIDESNKLI